jgi:hypothetical protein
MRLDTEIYTSEGVCHCTIKRIALVGREAVQVDLWRGSHFLKSRITVFRACVYMQWDGQRYSIVRNKPSRYANDFWLELEQTLSNTIIVNE